MPAKTINKSVNVNINFDDIFDESKREELDKVTPLPQSYSMN